jgi:hypothetical protein
MNESAANAMRLKLEERLKENREKLALIENLMRQQTNKRFRDRKHDLLRFLAVEKRVYTGIITELEKLL